MWHRLPYAQKRQPARSALRARRPRRRAVARRRLPPGTATLGAAREVASRSAGTTSSTSSASTCRRFEIDVHNVTNADFLEFVDAGGYADPRAVDRERLGVASGGAASRIRRSGCAIDGTRGSGAACSRTMPLPPSWPVYVSQAEAAAFARWQGRRLPTEAEYHRAAFGTPRTATRARVSVGRRAAATRRAATSTSRRGIRCRPARVRRARAPGACTIWSATAGSGRRRLRAVPRLQPMASYPGVLRRLLRRPALRDEGRVAGDRAASWCAAASATGSGRTIRTSTPSSGRWRAG